MVDLVPGLATDGRLGGVVATAEGEELGGLPGFGGALPYGALADR